MSSPTQQPTEKKMTPDEKAGLLIAITQLDMLVTAFQHAPERVKKAGIEFRDSLKEWANVK